LSDTGRFRGVFAILVTPFTDGGTLDEMSLARCAEFIVAAGGHGIVGPVNASESIVLTDAERLRVAEILVEQAKGRVPVVIGVSGVSTEASALYAAHAARIGADSVIAMPPYVKHPSPGELLDFYRAVAKAADGLPVWVQNYVAPIGTPVSSAVVASIIEQVPNVDFVKEETAHAPQLMTDVVALAGEKVKGMMGGMAGRYLLEEVRRGACGTMPACEVTDAHVTVWDALERDPEEGRRLHGQLLPLLNYEAMYSFTIYKEVLYRRGVIASPKTRVPGAGKLDAENGRELDILLRDLEPLMTLGLIPDLSV
jgi:dihydrodipicolinate synthase/N-acetylneuraminate lyase